MDAFKRRPRVFAHVLFMIPAVFGAVLVNWAMGGVIGLLAWVPAMALVGHGIYSLGSSITFQSDGITVSRFGMSTGYGMEQIGTIASEMVSTEAAHSGFATEIDKSHTIIVYDRQLQKVFKGIFSVADWDNDLLEWMHGLHISRAKEMAKDMLSAPDRQVSWVPGLALSQKGIHQTHGRTFLWDDLESTDAHNCKGLIYAKDQGMPVLYLKTIQPRFAEGFIVVKACIADGKRGLERIVEGDTRRYCR